MTSSPMYAQWKQLKSETTAPFDDDDQSTTVPSDVMGAPASDISAWDTGNLEDLSSCGVLTSAELRAARLQKLSLASKAQAKTRSQVVQTVSKANAKATARPAPAVPKAATAASRVSGLPSSQVPARQHPDNAKLASSQSTRVASTVSKATADTPACGNEVDVDDQSTATPDSLDGSIGLEDIQSAGGLTSEELRAARCQMSKMVPHAPKPKAPNDACAKSAATMQAKADARKHINVGTQVKCGLDKSSREAIRDMGLWEYMPARNPVVTRNTSKGADWNIGFEEYEHTLGGVTETRHKDSRLVEQQEADKLARHFDVQSHEALKEMGLWQHRPAKNPVVTQQTKKGAAWHVGFEEYQHSSGGVPDSQPVERPPFADELNRHLDINSRGVIKEMGLWEHMPAKNPVVTRQTNKGADWHIGFEGYVHTLGGVPDSKSVDRPPRADELSRHLDKSSCEAAKRAGISPAFGSMTR